MAGEKPRVVPDATNHGGEPAPDREADEPGRCSDPQTETTSRSAAAFLAGGGEMGKRIRTFAWSDIPLGPIETWPHSLQTAVGLILGASSPLAVCWGADLILLYNDSWRDLIGDKHPNALGRPAREIFPEIWDTVGPALSKVMAGQGAAERRDQRLPVDRGQGVEDAWFDYTFNPIRQVDGSIGGVLNLASETTERVRAAQANRETAERLAFVVESSDDSVFLQDLDLRYVWLSKPSYPLVTENYLGRTDLEMDAPRAQRERLTEIKRRVIETGEPVTVELPLDLKGEQHHFHATYKPWRDAQEQVIGLAGYVRDVTPRHEAEEELRRERGLLRTIHDAVPVMLTIYDPAIGEVDLNRHVERVTGWTPEDTARTNIMELAYPDPEYRQEVAEYMQSVAPGFRSIRMTTQDGGVRDTLWANIAIGDGRRVGIGIDVTERKRVEEALRRSRERLAWVLDKTGVGTWLNELPLGRLNWDETTKELFFVSSDVEPTIDLFWDRLHPEDHERTKRAVDKAVHDGTLYAIDHRAVNPETGEVRWIHSVGQARYDEDGTPTQFDGINIDISDLALALARLRCYSERLRLLHQMDDRILAARSPEEVAEAILEQAPQLLPCRRASVALHDVEAKEMRLLAIHTDGRSLRAGPWGPVDSPWETVLERLREGKRYVIEDVQTLRGSAPPIAKVQAEGVRRYVYEPIMVGEQLVGSLNLGLTGPEALSDDQQEIVHELAVHLGVGLERARLDEELERYAGRLEDLVKQRTSELEASEARFRTIFEEASIGIALTDRAGRLVATNPALQQLLGRREDELPGHVLCDFLNVGRDDGAGLLRKLREGEWGEITDDVTYVGEEGETRHAQVVLSPLPQETASSPFLLVLVEDLTERKRAQEMLIEAERLTAMGRMGLSLAHEINNPLQSVVGCLGLAIEAPEIGGDTAEFLELALEELKRASRIVQRLRDISAPDDGRRELGRVDALIDRVLALTENQAETRRVNVIWERGENLPAVWMVEDQIHQVFLNLVLNAVDAMPDGGTLRIGAEPTVMAPGVQVSFADTGIGIAPDELERLFEAFHRSKQERLGLGLYVARNIVKNHGGWIDAESQVGKGSTFRLWLPDDGGGGAGEQRSAGAEEPGSGGAASDVTEAQG